MEKKINVSENVEERYLKAKFGEDGNPEVEMTCDDQTARNLCVAILAALAANVTDPASWLISVTMNAAELLERVE